MWWLTVPLSPSCPRREVCGYPQRCPLAHPTHSLSTNWYLFHPFPPHCTGLTQGLNTSQWRLHLVLVFPPYTEPHLAAKKIFPRHKSAHVLHLLKSPRWYPLPTGLVPDPRRDFQVPCILGPSSLSRLVSCHAPGEHAMLFPPSCLCTKFLSLRTFLTLAPSNSYTSFQTKFNHPLHEDLLNASARIVRFFPSSSCSMAMPLLSYL